MFSSSCDVYITRGKSSSVLCTFTGVRAICDYITDTAYGMTMCFAHNIMNMKPMKEKACEFRCLKGLYHLSDYIFSVFVVFVLVFCVCQVFSVSFMEKNCLWCNV